MTDTTPEPIRKGDLPCTPPPEWEFHTWFPHPDGGGDMVRGQRQRGVLVRRRVSYGDWEPVRPDRWADEPEQDIAAPVPPAADRAALAEDLRYVLNYRGPGHAHEKPGVWDTSGKPCEHCARLAVARRNLAAYDADPDAALSVLPASTDRATVLREVAAECDKAGGAYGQRGANDAAGAAFALMETFLRKADEAEYVATPCDFAACEPGGEPCSTHERLMAHAEGDHELCAPGCATPRRMAAETPQPETPPCAGCGKPVRLITGTLATWWVHDPGGHTVCFPQQAATSPRATPAVVAQPVHVGGNVNAEDCPACEGSNPPYPFICPSPNAAPAQPAKEPVQCTASVLRKPHGPHGWEPQPGMTPVRCPGFCNCEHPDGEHSVYGCAEGCPCEFLPARGAAAQPAKEA
jgi:hypothetical protein